MYGDLSYEVLEIIGSAGKFFLWRVIQKFIQCNEVFNFSLFRGTCFEIKAKFLFFKSRCVESFMKGVQRKMLVLVPLVIDILIKEFFHLCFSSLHYSQSKWLIKVNTHELFR